MLSEALSRLRARQKHDAAAGRLDMHWPVPGEVWIVGGVRVRILVEPAVTVAYVDEPGVVGAMPQSRFDHSDVRLVG